MLAILVAAFLAARVVSGVVIDRLWFDTVTTAPVWAGKIGAQALLVGIAGLVAGLALVGSALFAHKTRPAPGNGPNRVMARYRERMGPAHKWLLVGLAAYIALRFAWSAMAGWQEWLLFLHGPGLGVSAPEIGWDLGYHLFRLPFLTAASSWLRELALIALVFSTVGCVANGALRIPRQGRKSSVRALRLVSVWVAVFAVLQAADYALVRWPGTATDHFGGFDGAGFTQVNVVVPSLWALTLVAVAVAALVLRVPSGGRWRAALWGLGAWGLLHLVLLGLLPPIVNRLFVAPATADRQLEYIAHNLEATRTAYKLDTIEEVALPLADGLSAVPQDQTGVDSVPIFSDSMLVDPLQVLQGTTGTRITDVDLDRYLIDGVVSPVMIGARNANRADLPEAGWVQQHLVYTHGDGVVAVPANSAAPDGRPDVSAFADSLALDRPELYFGEGLARWYAIVGTKREELGGASFSGDTGIALSNVWRRLALALTVGESAPLLSTELEPGSQLLYRRDIVERLSELAPFLCFDANPYPVVADGRITWIVDGYTTASTYPYSQYARSVGLSGESGLASPAFNYVHASVKATVDAYDGTVHLYRTVVGGAADPILDAWDAIFPGLLEPIDEMPSSLQAHLLYPQDLLTVQTAMLGRYHVTDAETLFNGSDSWAISQAAGDGVARPGAENAAATTPTPAAAVSLLMPANEPFGGHWVAIRPYGAGSAGNPTSARDELAALAIADHDDPEHLTLVRIETQPGHPVSSPQVAQAAIDTDRDLAAAFTLLNANGSAVQFGPMTPIPLEGALIWSRSIIVTGTADTTAPRLYGAAAVSNGLVGESESVSGALSAAINAG